MEPKLNCGATAAILWASIPLLGHTPDSKFALVRVLSDAPGAGIALDLLRDLDAKPFAQNDTDMVFGPLTESQIHNVRLYALNTGDPHIALIQPEKAGDDMVVEFEAEEGDESESLLNSIFSDIAYDNGGEPCDCPACTRSAPERTLILMDADECVSQNRNSQYGEPENNLATIAAFWSLILGAEVSPQQVALCMAALKIARCTNGQYHRDNFVDGAGYIALAGEMASIEQLMKNRGTIH